MKIAIGCDHGALALKNKMAAHLTAQGHEVKDFGTYTADSCDYPDFAAKAAQAVVAGIAMALLLRYGNSAWFSVENQGATGVGGTIGEALRTVRSLKEISIPALIGDGAFITGWLLSEVRRWRAHP